MIPKYRPPSYDLSFGQLVTALAGTGSFGLDHRSSTGSLNRLSGNLRTGCLNRLGGNLLGSKAECIPGSLNRTGTYSRYHSRQSDYTGNLLTGSGCRIKEGLLTGHHRTATLLNLFHWYCKTLSQDLCLKTCESL